MSDFIKEKLDFFSIMEERLENGEVTPDDVLKAVNSMAEIVSFITKNHDEILSKLIARIEKLEQGRLH